MIYMVSVTFKSLLNCCKTQSGPPREVVILIISTKAKDKHLENHEETHVLYVVDNNVFLCILKLSFYDCRRDRIISGKRSGNKRKRQLLVVIVSPTKVKTLL